MNSVFKKAILLGTALSWPMMSAAQEITLKSADGGIDLTGELVEYQDNVYVLKLPLGTIRVAGDRVECIGAACPDTDVLDVEVTIAGSDTIALGLMPVLLSGYAASLEAEPQVSDTIGSVERNVQFIGNEGYGDLIKSFRVRSSVSSDAFANLLGKSTEIGVSSRRITVEEARTLKEYGAGSMVRPSNEHVMANDSIVVVTHPDNPVKSISMKDLAAVYNGEITNWSALGGTDTPINVVHLRRGAGTRSVFEERVMEAVTGAPARVVEAENVEAVARTVYSDPEAIGYVSYAFTYGAQPVTLTNECGISVEPTAFSAKTGEYPLTRPLYFYTRGDTVTPEAEEFISWAKSEEADNAILKTGFIDLSVSRVSQSGDSARATDLNAAMANMDSYEAGFAQNLMTAMRGYDRLSSTFRFRAGSSRLTPQSRVVLGRMIDYLADQPATTVKLAGFTDDQGAFTANIDLAQERADQMVQEIKDVARGRLDHITFETAGYGPLAPVACNASQNGRAINRRIEVWIQGQQG